MMEWLIGFYGLQVLGVVAILVLGWVYFDKRYKKKNEQELRSSLIDGSLERTSEVFVDPKDGMTYRVYYNRSTGEREYIQEDK